MRSASRRPPKRRSSRHHRWVSTAPAAPFRSIGGGGSTAGVAKEEADGHRGRPPTAEATPERGASLARRARRLRHCLFQGPPDGPGFVFRLLELSLGHGAGHDAGADGEMDPVVGHDRGADGDCGVEVAVVAEIAHGAAVQAAPLLLRLGDELHRPDLGRAREGPGREDAAESVEGVAAGLEPSLHVAHEMEDVAVLLDLHVLGHGHGSGPGHAAEVVAAQVHEHHVLGPLLGVVAELVGELVVLERSGAARPRAGDRVSGHAVALDADEQLGARAHDGELGHADEEQVRARVDAAERAIDVDGIERGGGARHSPDDRPLEGLSARDDDLDALAGGDRFLRVPYGGLVLATFEADLDGFEPEGLTPIGSAGTVARAGTGRRAASAPPVPIAVGRPVRSSASKIARSAMRYRPSRSGASVWSEATAERVWVR